MRKKYVKTGVCFGALAVLSMILLVWVGCAPSETSPPEAPASEAPPTDKSPPLEPLPSAPSSPPQSSPPPPQSSLPPPSVRFPEFPWPPPHASTFHVLDPSLLAIGREEPVLGDVAELLEYALIRTGYGEFGFYFVPGGFAMATRIEQIHADGSPKELPERWVAEMEPLSLRDFSLQRYIEALFLAAEGRYRVVVFIVTSDPFSQGSEIVSQEQAKVWLRGGLQRLPQLLRDTPYSEEHACTALIYDFQQSAPGVGAVLKDPSPLPAKAHLEKSGILGGLVEGRVIMGGLGE